MSRYAFSLDSRTLAGTVVGLCTIGALLFFSGVLVGVSTHLPAELPAPAPGPGALAAAGGVEDPADGPEERPAPATAPPADEDGVGGPGEEAATFAVQVGDFPREEPALEMLERLGRRGYEGYLVSGYDDDWRLRVQVRFGAWDDADAARLAAGEAEAREGWRTRVVAAEELAP